jgi:hypothetical protein
MAVYVPTDPDLKSQVRKYIIIVSAILLFLGTLVGILIKWMGSFSFICNIPVMCNVEGQFLQEPLKGTNAR